jgi:hypothetical protein
MMNTLPYFEEDTHDIPTGYGIDHNHDGGFYPYRIEAHHPLSIVYLKDEQGLDLRCTSRDAAVQALHISQGLEVRS